MKLPVPTLRAAVVAGALALLVIVTPGPPVTVGAVFAALFTALVGADILVAPRPESLRVRRDHQRIVSVGEHATLTWTVSVSSVADDAQAEMSREAKFRRRAFARLHSVRRSTIALSDQLPPSLGAATRRATFTLPPSGESAVAVRICPQRRGHFSMPGVTLRVTGPLGLAARQRFASLETDLAVYPALGTAREADLWVRRTRVADVGIRSARHHGGGSEFDSMRDYSVDDEFRRIDWAATSRQARPVVRTYRAEVDQRLICLLDSGRTMSSLVDGVPRFEHALDALLMLTAVSTRLGDRCGVVVFDAAVHAAVEPARLGAQLGRVSEAVYRSHPSLVESDYHTAFSFLLRRFGRRSMVVLFSELVESAVAESLVPALALLAREHRVAVASVSDPKVAGWADESAADADAAYRKAAARWELDRRRRTAALLSARGVSVVDAPPRRLPAAVADLYVRAKARGPL